VIDPLKNEKDRERSIAARAADPTCGGKEERGDGGEMLLVYVTKTTTCTSPILIYWIIEESDRTVRIRRQKVYNNSK
jgi:hypothetical protein